jgi:hypothetical protein
MDSMWCVEAQFLTGSPWNGIPHTSTADVLLGNVYSARWIQPGRSLTVPTRQPHTPDLPWSSSSSLAHPLRPKSPGKLGTSMLGTVTLGQTSFLVAPNENKSGELGKDRGDGPVVEPSGW